MRPFLRSAAICFMLLVLGWLGCGAVQARQPADAALALSGLTPPEPVDPDDWVEVTRLGEQTLPASSHTALRIALHAPAGWKVNVRAPGMLSITVQGAGAYVPEAYRQRTFRPMRAQLDVPLHVADAGHAALLRVHLSFVLCLGGDEGVCVPRQVAWEVPVRSQTHAAQAELVLHDRMISITRDF